MRRRQAGRAAIAGVVALATLAGCGGGDEQESLPSPSSTAPGPAPSSPAASTTAPAGRCPGGDPVPPDGAEDVSEAGADVDGDGAEDRILAYRRPDGSRRIAVELAAGGTAAVDASAVDVEGPAPLSVLGGLDLGEDGDTVAAVTGAGASVVVVSLFELVDCDLVPVAFESGEPVEVPVGGGVTHGDGLACAGDILVRRSATSTDGETFDTTDVRYRLEGNTLVEVGTGTATLTRGADDEEINSHYTLACPGLENSL